MAEPLPTMRIPGDQRDDVALLARLPDDQFKSLVKALEAMQPTMSVRRATTRLAKDSGIVVGDVSKIVGVVGSLYLTKDRRGLTTDHVAASVARSAAAAKLTSPDDNAEGGALRDRLAALLKFERTLGVMVKASNLLYSFPNVYKSGRIVTDIRPIFSSSNESDLQPVASVIVHTLVVEVMSDEAEGDETRSIYITLDAEDLKELRGLVARAAKKEDALHKVLAAKELAPVRVDRF